MKVLTPEALATELGMDGNREFVAAVQSWWEYYGEDPRNDETVRYALAKVKAIDVLKAARFPRVDWTQAHTSQRNNQAFQALVLMRQEALEDLALARTQVRLSGGPAVGQLVTQAPLDSPPTSRLDPNARYLRGDPRYRGPSTGGCS